MALDLFTGLFNEKSTHIAIHASQYNKWYVNDDSCKKKQKQKQTKNQTYEKKQIQ